MTKAVPDGFHTITPHLVCADAPAALAFYAKAFGAVELYRMPGPDGKLMHAMMRIGSSLLMLNDEMPAFGTLGPTLLKGTPVTLHLQVEDADALFAQAVAAGATVRMPIAQQFWGDRYGIVIDPFGHQWSIATHVRDMTQYEMMEAGRMAMAASTGCN